MYNRVRHGRPWQPGIVSRQSSLSHVCAECCDCDKWGWVNQWMAAVAWLWAYIGKVVHVIGRHCGSSLVRSSYICMGAEKIIMYLYSDCNCVICVKLFLITLPWVMGLILKLLHYGSCIIALPIIGSGSVLQPPWALVRWRLQSGRTHPMPNAHTYIQRH